MGPSSPIGELETWYSPSDTLETWYSPSDPLESWYSHPTHVWTLDTRPHISTGRSGPSTSSFSWSQITFAIVVRATVTERVLTNREDPSPFEDFLLNTLLLAATLDTFRCDLGFEVVTSLFSCPTEGDEDTLSLSVAVFRLPLDVS